MAQTILYAASTFGHMASFHMPYIRELAARGHRVVLVAAGRPPEDVPPGVVSFPVPFTKSMSSPHNVRATLDIARIIREQDVQLILVHTSLAAYFVRMAVRLSGRRPRVVNTVHGYLFDDATPWAKRAVLLAAEKMTACVTDAVVTMNGQDTSIAREHHLARSVAEVPGMGVDPARFGVATPDEKGQARRALGIRQEAFVLLYAAEFSARKNQRMLVDAMTGLPPDVVLALPGSGALHDEMREMVRKLGMQDRVMLPGQVADPAPWRAAADICVSSSRSEGLPFHAIEAMGSGLPLVLSDVKGHEDLIDDADVGLLYAYGDVRGFVDSVLALKGDDQLREDMGVAARYKARRYALPNVMPKVMSAWGLDK